MYLDFYQLRKTPFNLTPDPEFLFLSPSHQQALGAILYGIWERKGLIVVTGEVGLGKTTLLRAALEQVGARQGDTQRLTIISTFQANVSLTRLLALLARELQVPYKPDDPDESVSLLIKILQEKESQGSTVVLIIDEAQELPLETLHQLRLFLNLETNTAKLLQVVLVGQPELKQKLDLPEVRALKQCVAIQETLSPMTPKESIAYIEHRLGKVTLGREPIFSTGALQLIAARAQGVPRTLNIFCDNILIAGFADQKRPIPTALAREVIAELEGKPDTKKWGVKLTSKPVRAAIVGVLVVLLGSLLYWQFDALLAWQGGALLRSPQREDRTPKLQERKDAFAPQFSLTRPETYTPPVVESQSSEAIASTSPEPPVAPKPEEQELRKIAVVKMTEPESQSSSDTVGEPSLQKFPLTRVVKKGDYLSKMIADIYGKSSTQLVLWVKTHNPQIRNVDRLQVGLVITFPAPDESIDRTPVRIPDGWPAR